VRAAAHGLSGANVTVLNGAEGLNETVASLAVQGTAILRSVLDGLGPRDDAAPAAAERSARNGRAPAAERVQLEG
jgi:hypothetical protein